MCFKVLWQENIPFLKRVLNAFLPLPKNARVVDIVVMDSWMSPDNLDSDLDKSFVVDLRVTIHVILPGGRVVEQIAVVEMQNYEESFMFERLLAYWARAYAKAIKRGCGYGTAKAVYILAFTPDKFKQSPNDNYYNAYVIRNTHTGELYSNDLNIITLEFAKFFKELDELVSEGEKLSYVFKYTESMSLSGLVSVLMRGDIMSQALQRLVALDHGDELLRAYDLKERITREVEAREKSRNKKLIDQGEARGVAKGEARGVAKGVAKGVAEEKQQTARKMLQKGFELDMISDLTQLSQQKILEIAKDI